MTNVRSIRSISSSDREIHDYVAANPGALRRDIADNLGMSRDTVAHRLQAFVASGYLERVGPQWLAMYNVAGDLPAPADEPPRTCPVCDGRWEPKNSDEARDRGDRNICSACLGARVVRDYARRLGVSGLRLVVAPLATRTHMPHPLEPTGRVWVDTPDDLDWVLIDAGRTGLAAAPMEAMAA